MTDRPIIFSAPMVRALLDGRKTQTRRVLKPRGFRQDVQIPIAVGDRLWVRENWRTEAFVDDEPPRDLNDGDVWIRYEADPHDQEAEKRLQYPPKWGRLRPSIHMPRWASRLTLTVTNVRLERLQWIRDKDAWEEGVGNREQGDMRGAALYFKTLWNSIHGPGAWEENPWVAAYTFTVQKRKRKWTNTS